MANTGVKGRIIYAETQNVGASGLKVAAFDIDYVPDEEFLGETVTDSNGNFEITYTPDQYRKWHKNKPVGEMGEFSNPDIVLRVYTPDLRLVYEMPKRKDVKETTLDVGAITIHKNNIEGWLVTDATLHPTIGAPVRYEKGNRVEWLVDGASLFPLVTDDVINATKSINLMNLNFWVSDTLITKFHFKITTQSLDRLRSEGLPEDIISKLSTITNAVFTDQKLFLSTIKAWVSNEGHISLILKHVNPPEGGKVEGVLLHEEMKKKSSKMPVHIMVNDLPGPWGDSFKQVNEYFEGSPVKVRGFRNPGNSIMHGKVVIIDGEIAYVMGSTFSQSYHNDVDHLIRDPKRGGSDEIIHDANLKVVGPAIKHLDRTFTTLWNAADSSAPPLAPKTDQKAADVPGIGVQVLRTLPGGLTNSSQTDGSVTPHGETSVLEAYQRAIANAENLIYLETQYFTSPDIVTALVQSLKKSSKLEAIIVLPIKPDFPGYPALQNRYVKQLLAKAKEFNFEDRLGIFTLWSCQQIEKTFEIRPIYVHSKTGLVDDKWATIGSANLDGAGLNQTQVQGIPIPIADNVMGLLGVAVVILLGILNSIWAWITAAAYLLLQAILTKQTGFDLDKKPTQHANPQQSKQPDRSTEVNLAVYNIGEPGLLPHTKVSELRDLLWSEHLGVPMTDLSDKPPAGYQNWVKYWESRADEKLKAIKDKKQHSTKILAWTPENDPEDYLEALGVITKGPNIDIKEKLETKDKFDFKTGKWLK